MIDEIGGDFLQWLRGFYYVAKSGGIRQAAELMNRNPSTISHQIRSLEKELNTVLFDRHNKTLSITPEGKKLLGWTISTFETLQNMRSAVGSAPGRLQGTVQFATVLPFATLAVKPIAAFCREYPLVDINLFRWMPQEVVDAVKDARVDFGLVGMTKKPEVDELEVWLKARPLLVAHKGVPWNIPAVPSEDDLRRLPFVSFLAEGGRNDSSLGSHFEGGKSVLRVNNYHLIMRFVWQRLGVTIVDELSFQSTAFGAHWDQLVTWPLDHLLPNVLYGPLMRRHKHISPQAKALLDTLREHFLSLPPLHSPGMWDDIRQREAASEA